MIVRRIAAATAFLAVALAGSPNGRAQSHGFEAGRPFPLVPLASADDGRLRTLADFRGRKIVLHVFASW